MALTPTPPLVIFLAAWVSALVFAVLVLATRGGHRPSRGLGLFLLFFTGMAVALGLNRMETDAATAQIYLDAAFLLALPTPFLLFHHLATYPRQRWTVYGGWVPLLVALPIVAVEGAYLAWPGWWAGTITAVESVIFLATSVASLVLLVDFLREPEGPVRESLLLMSAGWATLSLIDGWWWALTRYRGPLDANSYFIWALGVLAVYVVALVTTIFLCRAPRSDPPLHRRRRAVYLAALAPAFAGSSVAGSIFHLAGPGPGFDAVLVAAAIACAGGTFLLVYAAVKHQMLGVDLKVKRTVKASAVAAAFAVAFLVGGEVLERLLGVEDLLLGVAAAAAIGLVLRPVQGAAERVASAVVPGAKPVAAMSADERHDLYREQARYALADGAIGARERRILEAAREGLGLSVEAATAIERDAVEQAAQAAQAGQAPQAA